MADEGSSKVMASFKIIQPAAETVGPRLGRLLSRGRDAIDTPHYISNTSRGVVSHLSQDNYARHTSLTGAYVALEDFIEKYDKSPIYKIARRPSRSALRDFIALPDSSLLVLGARRNPPVPSPAANTNTGIGICTNVGFSTLSSEDYARATHSLRPDIAIGLGDVAFPLTEKSSGKRMAKMSDRTGQWVQDMIAAQEEAIDDQDVESEKTSLPSIFAPLLPIPLEIHWEYVEQLQEEDIMRYLSGLAVYDSSYLPAIFDRYPKLHTLPRLSLEDPASPHALLRAISLGIDLFTIPFITSATDAGIALDFAFPPPAPKTDGEGRQSLGIDMWSSSHATDLFPLVPSCKCYTCTKHHRAYIQHLLAAKEMLGWVLLQIHNHAIVDAFFASIRSSISHLTFEAGVDAFTRFYEPQLPAKTGQGPRVRGYQYKSEKGQRKVNPSAYRMLDEGKEVLAEGASSGAATPADVARRAEEGDEVLERQGFAEFIDSNEAKS